MFIYLLQTTLIYQVGHCNHMIITNGFDWQRRKLYEKNATKNMTRKPACICASFVICH